MAKRKQPPVDPLKESRERNARYAGLLGRLAGFLGLPMDPKAENIDEERINALDRWLTIQEKMRGERTEPF